MKKFLFAALLAASFGVSTAQANEVFADSALTSGLSGVSSSAAQNLKNCLYADTELASSKAIRACSKAYADAIPLPEIRSDILTRRGLLLLSAKRFDQASRDFKAAAKINAQNEFASLGEGYAALMNQDYAKATEFFQDCSAHKDAAPLAMYGLALTKEASGDINGAIASYRKAAEMRPDWDAPRAELLRVKTSA